MKPLIEILRSVRMECLPVEQKVGQLIARNMRCKCSNCQPLIVWLSLYTKEPRYWTFEEVEIMVRAAIRSDERESLCYAWLLVRHAAKCIEGLRIHASDLHWLEQWHAEVRNSLEAERIAHIFRFHVINILGEEKAADLFAIKVESRDAVFMLDPYFKHLIDEHGLIFGPQLMQSLKRAAEDYITKYSVS